MRRRKSLHVAFVMFLIPETRDSGSCLPTPITPLPRSKHTLSAHICPPSHVSSNGGLGYGHHPPSLTRNATRRPLLPTPALRVVFRAMEGSFTSITPPCRILQPSMPSLTQNASRRAVLLPPTLCPTFWVTEGFFSCPPRPPSLETRVGGSVLPPSALHLTFRVTEGSVMPCLTRNMSLQIHSAPTTPSPTPLSLMQDRGEFTFTFDVTRGNIPLITSNPFYFNTMRGIPLLTSNPWNIPFHHIHNPSLTETEGLPLTNHII